MKAIIPGSSSKNHPTLRGRLNRLDDDILCHVFQYLDYETSRRFLNKPNLKLWKEFFLRENFSGSQTDNYYTEFRNRQLLLENLFQSVVVIPETNPAASSWNAAAVSNPLRHLNVTFQPRHTLVFSVDYFRRNRTHQNSLFQFQLASTSVQNTLIVLERDNRHQVVLCLTDVSGYCRQKHVLLEQTTDADVRLLNVKYREDVHMVGLMFSSESETTVHFWSYDLPKVLEKFSFTIAGSCAHVDYSINDKLEPVLYVLRSNQLERFTLNQMVPAAFSVVAVKGEFAALGQCVLTGTAVLVHQSVPWLQGSIQVVPNNENIPIHEALNRAFEDSKRDLSFLCSPVLFVRGAPDRPNMESHVFSPRHLAITQCGFVTLHTSRESFRAMTSGNHTLLFWEPKRNEKYGWGIYAMINLPLLPSKTPQVHYDGNRLIVFGQDHIGKILLIYQVRKCACPSPSPARETSGGVYNFKERRVEFRNRIRHQALETDVDLQLSCNERFITVQTKRGNLVLEGQHSPSDGVLLFDCGVAQG